MRHLLPFLLLPFIIGGCAAAAGAAAGSAVSTPDAEVKKYVRTHDIEPRIARAVEGGYVVKGMTKKQVRLAEGDPDSIDEDGSVWRYQIRNTKEFLYEFEDGTLVDGPTINP